MSPSVKHLLEEVLRLGEADRASIAGILIESLHEPAQPGVDDAWADVIARRVAELDLGKATTVPWSEVRARLFDGFE